MKKNIYNIALSMAAAVLSLTSCVKDELYNTPHPDKGVVEISTDWSDAISESDIPSAYYLKTDDDSPVETGEKTVRYPKLLTPGKHMFSAYNIPDGIHVNGAGASVTLSGNGLLNPMPGYLFSSVKEVDVLQDHILQVDMPMKRRVCPIRLKLTLTGGKPEEIAHVEATLSGVAGSVNLHSGVIGDESFSLMPVITPTDGTLRSSAEVEMRCRVLGVNPRQRQLLSVTLTMKDGHQEEIISDLTDRLKDVNATMRPVDLTGSMDALQNGEFGGTITDWTETDDFEIDVQ